MKRRLQNLALDGIYQTSFRISSSICSLLKKGFFFACELVVGLYEKKDENISNLDVSKISVRSDTPDCKNGTEFKTRS